MGAGRNGAAGGAIPVGRGRSGYAPRMRTAQTAQTSPEPTSPEPTSPELTSPELAARALDLPPDERLALADALVASVDPLQDPVWRRAWTEAVEARRAGGAHGARPWGEVRERLRRGLDGG